MENKHTPTPWVIKGNIICGNTINTHIGFCYRITTESNPNGTWKDCEIEKANREFIVTACNNYQALKEENTLLKEVNEAQIFTIEKYQKENESLTTQLAKANSDKEKAVALVKEMQQYIDLLFNEAILDDCSDIGRKGSNLYDQAHNLLTDCGITL